MSIRRVTIQGERVLAPLVRLPTGYVNITRCLSHRSICEMSRSGWPALTDGYSALRLI